MPLLDDLGANFVALKSTPSGTEYVPIYDPAEAGNSPVKKVLLSAIAGSSYNPANVAITGGTMNGVVIGATVAEDATFDSLVADSADLGITTILSADIETLNLTNDLSVANGGTGASSFTNNRVLTGNGTSAIVDEANLTFDGTTLAVTGTATLSTPLAVASGGTGTNTGSMTIASTWTVSAGGAITIGTSSGAVNINPSGANYVEVGGSGTRGLNCTLSQTGGLIITSRAVLQATSGGSFQAVNAGYSANVPVLRSMAVSASAATPETLDVTTNDTLHTNEGATALAVRNLPAAAVGLIRHFYVQDADGIQVVAAAGDTIRVAASVSAAAGNIQATTIGNAVTLVAINATEWVATSVVGTWTVT